MNEIIIRSKLLLNSKLVFTQLVFSVYNFFYLFRNIEIWFTWKFKEFGQSTFGALKNSYWPFAKIIQLIDGLIEEIHWISTPITSSPLPTRLPPIPKSNLTNSGSIQLQLSHPHHITHPCTTPCTPPYTDPCTMQCTVWLARHQTPILTPPSQRVTALHDTAAILLETMRDCPKRKLQALVLFPNIHLGVKD